MSSGGLQSRGLGVISEWSRVFDTEALDRHTIVLETEAGTEYLIGSCGGVLFVPREDQD